MFDDIPELYRSQTADNEEEGWRYTQGDRDARRPPELLTRDHVARCIVREVQQGRGSPHGGVFLDIAWIQEKMPNSAAHIRRKLPSMYHQFKELAGIDITAEPMEVGPTTHYAMGGVRVDPDSQMTSVSGLFAAGECGAGLHGANRLGGNSLSDLLVFGQRAGEYAARFAKENGRTILDEDQIGAISNWALKPLESQTRDSNDNPYQIQYSLQEMMQELVGIARNEEGLSNALSNIADLRQRSESVTAIGNREYNSGWHTALDLHNLMICAEAIALAALERKASIGAHSRDDYPDKEEPNTKKYNTIVRKGANGEMQILREEIPEVRADLQEIIEEIG